GIVAVGLYASMVAVGSFIRPPKLPPIIVEVAGRQYSEKLIFWIMLLCFVLAMLNYALASDFSLAAMVQGLQEDRFGSPWARGQFGGWEAFRDFLTNFGYVVPTFTVVLALRHNSWRKPPVVAGLICSIITLAFLAQSGSRRTIVVVVGA